MRALKTNAVLFAVGGIGYGILEWLWRGYTHWSMLCAGGICFVLFAKIARHCRRHSLIVKAVLCALTVTAVEFVFGVIFNLLLQRRVWDYSEMPFHLLGQICPQYSLLWGLLGLVFVPLADRISRRLDA